MGEHDEDDEMEQHEVHTPEHLDEDLCRVYPCCSLAQRGLEYQVRQVNREPTGSTRGQHNDLLLTQSGSD